MHRIFKLRAYITDGEKVEDENKLCYLFDLARMICFLLEPDPLSIDGTYAIEGNIVKASPLMCRCSPKVL